MRFKRDEWVPGARAVFERLDGYVARDEPAAWMAGGKRIAVPRTEWLTVSDPATASAALLNGEVDWWERTVPDLAPMLERNSDVIVRPQDEYGFVGLLIFTHLHPPFSDMRARRAVLMALAQVDYMRRSSATTRGCGRPCRGTSRAGPLCPPMTAAICLPDRATLTRRGTRRFRAATKASLSC